MTSEWGGGSVTTSTRQQFIALVNTVGSVHHARRLMKHIIITKRPGELDAVPDSILQSWAMRAADGEEVPPKIEAAVKKRLMGWEEWANREVIHSYREAAVATAGAAAEYKLPAEKQVQLKYLADGIAMMTRDTSGAFGSVKPSQTQIGNAFFLGTGNKPAPRKLRARQQQALAAGTEIMDAEFKEVDVADSNP